MLECDLLKGAEGVVGWALMSSGGCGQAASEKVKEVPRNSQEKSQKRESVLTYLERTKRTPWSHSRNKGNAVYFMFIVPNYICNVAICP